MREKGYQVNLDFRVTPKGSLDKDVEFLRERAEYHRKKAFNMDDVYDAKLHADHQNYLADQLERCAERLEKDV